MTESVISLIGIAAVVYALTDIDDLLLLAVFFADPRVRVGAVVVGRLLGTAALVLASGAAALLALAVPPEWIALLGFVPLILGVRLLPAQFRKEGDEDSAEAEDAVGSKVVSRHGFAAQAFTVAGVTLANGGDNLGVYIPLFASTPSAVATYAVVFAVMTLVWCALGYAVVNNPVVGSRIRRYGHVLLPGVLIALGLFILAGTLPLLR
jgi:cadmium resistance protein CadD (predicted permease)